MTKRTRVITILIFGLLFSIIICGIGIIVNCSITNIRAIPDDASATRLTTNLYSTNGSINRQGVVDLLTTINYWNNSSDKNTYKAHQIISRNNSGNYAGDNTIVFPMGYYVSPSGVMDTSKPIYWQVVYLSNGYLVVWMKNAYTVSCFNKETSTISSSESPFAGYTTIPDHDYRNSYENSILRDSVNNIYNLISNKLANFDSIVVQPSIGGSNWIGTQANVYTLATDYSTHSNSLYDTRDRFWLPSAYEIFNAVSGSENRSDTNGLWGLNSSDNGYTDIRLDTGAASASSSSGWSIVCWLRSSCSISNNITNSAMRVHSLGNSTGGSIGVSHGVRPATILSLDKLKEYSGYNINASVNNLNINVNKNSDIFVPNLPQNISFTYTADPKYYVDSITINNQLVGILDSQPGSYSNVTGGQYMCYRNGNQVIVTVTNLTQAMTITGSANSLFDLSSNNPTLLIQDTTTITPDTYFDTTAEIVATFEQNQNIMFTIDGVAVRLYGNNSSGTVTVSSGTLNYSHNIHDNYVVIELTNLPKTHHTFTIDHYVGATSQITVNSAGGSGGDVQTYIEDNGLRRIVFSPTSDSEWVYSVTIDSIEVLIQYYKAEIYGAGGFSTIRYIAKDSTNTFTLEIEGVYESSHITFNLSTQKPTYQVPPTSSGGFGVSGTVVAAGIGGEARIVGNDIANGDSDDTVTFVAVAYTGYKFVGWVDASNETDIISTASSVRLTKDQTNGKIIKALFAPIDNSGINDATDDSEHDFV